MKIKIFADGANLADMLAWYGNGSLVQGFTTNPTLMKKAGITDYEAFAKEVLARIPDLPISFEVFADELPEMERQARKIASWGPNVYVKIPVTTTAGVSTAPVVRSLSAAGVQVNVTAVFTVPQVKQVLDSLSREAASIISIFAGRIANAGVDPMPIVKKAVELAKPLPKCEILWASPREALNVIQAEECGCHIITMTPDLLAAMKTFGKDLEEYSLETVQMFYRDAQSAGYRL
ncbi:transaldolase [Nitrospira sp. Kam-Ns4a]